MPKKETQPLGFPGLNLGNIVGGVEAIPNDFPFMVDMRRGGHWCGASLINEEWVVTVADCTTAAPSDYSLTIGDHNINVVEGTEQTRQAVMIITHPEYGTPFRYENDIALMKVSPPFNFISQVQPVILPEFNFAPTVLRAHYQLNY
ncbi:anionic trypsin-1 [Folsomia candida]|uniref:anionic trypsin-1 n=1 Tax=Folsomia candida TaxID=158441 RepID=UPI000B908140|nr:anionic trypsin-1 [Folsomia candida]